MPYPYTRVVIARLLWCAGLFCAACTLPFWRWFFLHTLRHSAKSTSTASPTSEAVRAVTAVLTLVSANLPVDVLRLKLAFVAFAQRARESDLLSG